MAQELAAENPTIFDDFVPDEFALELPRGDATRRDVLGIGHYTAGVINDLGGGVKQAVTLHPFEAIKRITNIARKTTAKAIEIANMPVSWTIGLTAGAAALYKANHKCTPYKCVCKGTLNQYNACVFKLNEGLKAVNSALVSFVKGYGEEMAYNFSPTKVGGVAVQVAGTLGLGVEEGIVNSISNNIAYGASGWTMLGNVCDYEDGLNSLDEGMLNLIYQLATIATVLVQEVERLVEEVGKLLADAHTALVA